MNTGVTMTRLPLPTPLSPPRRGTYCLRISGCKPVSSVRFFLLIGAGVSESCVRLVLGLALFVIFYVYLTYYLSHPENIIRVPVYELDYTRGCMRDRGMATRAAK